MRARTRPASRFAFRIHAEGKRSRVKFLRGGLNLLDLPTATFDAAIMVDSIYRVGRTLCEHSGLLIYQSADGARGVEPESISLGLKEDRLDDEDVGGGFSRPAILVTVKAGCEFAGVVTYDSVDGAAQVGNVELALLILAKGGNRE